MPIPTTQSETTQQSGLVSVVFWLCLLLAAGMYALVVLAPKWQTHRNLKVDYHRNQLQLVSLEQDVERLDRIVGALENDPDFAAEVARVDFGVVRPGDELLPVDDHLTVSLQSFQQPSQRPASPNTRTAAVIRLFSEHQSLRHITLAAAGLLVLLAFALLIDPGQSDLCCDGDSSSLLTRLISRYRK